MCCVWLLTGRSVIESVFSKAPLKPNQSSSLQINQSRSTCLFLFCASSTHQNISLMTNIPILLLPLQWHPLLYIPEWITVHHLLPWQQSEAASLYCFSPVGPKVLLLVAMLLQKKQKKFVLDEPVNMFMLNLEPHVHIHGEKSQRRRKYWNSRRTGLVKVSQGVSSSD